jgi:hypothetical protein
MAPRTPSTSSSSIHSAITSSSINSLLQDLHPLPSVDSSIPPPAFTLSDIVFVVGEGDSSREMCEIVDIGYKASEKCYVYDCVPLYLRKPKFLVGDVISGLSQRHDMTVLDVRCWSGRFCYKLGRRKPKEDVDAEEEELLLEEEDLVKMVEGRLQENARP